METIRKICTFHIDNFFFGIDVEHIQEVIRYQEMAHVPLANAVIGGLINIRGQIVTALNMRERLGFISSDKQPMNIIVRWQDSLVSLLVDNIGDVIDIPIDEFRTAPENVKGNFQLLLKEICQIDEDLLLILDVDELLKIDN